jgi:two-component system, LytTR family, sensor kinase
MEVKKIVSLFRNRLLQHILFWCFSFFVLLNLFTGSGKAGKIDYIYTALFHLTVIPFVYLNLMVFIPVFLSRGRYLLYTLSLIMVIPCSADLNILLFDRWIDHVLPGYYFISYYSLSDIIKIMAVYTAVTTLIKLSRGWFMLSDANRRLSQLQKENAETELRVLKGQINPHFLFNSLNGIYSLALRNSERTPETVLKLSDILRYVIYETNADLISLSVEIKYLKDYIDLQKIRSDSRADIEFSISGEFKNIMIPPMLLLPLVENSFKHGVKGSANKSYIKMNLHIDKNDVSFVIENNKGMVDDVELKDYKGVGLDNVRKRLEMIYPESHEFLVIDSDDFFRVDMKIKNITSKDED